LIGADKIVAAGYIDDNMIRFYKTLLESSSLDEAMAHVADELKQFHAEKFFYVIFARYMKRACMGSGGAQRVERLITESLNRGIQRNRTNLRALRRKAKQFVKSPEGAFNKRARHFLHGRLSVSFAEFQRFVRGDA
jgi:hypothetical protein